MYAAYNKKNTITAISEHVFSLSGQTVIQLETDLPKDEWHSLIGTKLKTERKQTKDLKIAFICNWNDFCGISTYSKFLVEGMLPKVKELRVFSEICPKISAPDESFVTRCWKRGTSMKPCVDLIKEYQPDFIIIQHEFGIFPKATHFLQFLQSIEEMPYIATMHSVYEHLDKSVCTAAVKNIVVHTEQAKEILRKTGNSSRIFIVNHGCVQFQEEQKTELWNIFQTPYALVQFGFGFYYKGVDKVLDALHYLKQNNKKFEEIFYCYLCSENSHTSNVHTEYYEYLLKKIETLGLTENAVIIRKFQTEQTINSYLRTAKVALFPYISDPKNTVYGASGAIRVAMANNIPVIASACHQFDDLDGVVPRPKDYVELAKEIDNVFSSEKYRKVLLAKSAKYINENTWSICADKYLSFYYAICD